MRALNPKKLRPGTLNASKFICRLSLRERGVAAATRAASRPRRVTDGGA